MPPPQLPRESVLQDPQIAPPYCDLWVQEIVTKPDHDNKRFYACGVIANRGSAPPSGPIRIYTVVLADVYKGPQYGWTQESTQEWRWYHAGTSLPFRTDWTSAPLHYVEEDGGEYQVWMYVGDPENLVGDRNPNNNSNFIQCPPFLKPATFHEEMNEPLRREARVEDGKLTSTLTIGGKLLNVGTSTTRPGARVTAADLTEAGRPTAKRRTTTRRTG
jgi:hypothetical protein